MDRIERYLKTAVQAPDDREAFMLGISRRIDREMHKEDGRLEAMADLSSRVERFSARLSFAGTVLSALSVAIVAVGAIIAFTTLSNIQL